MGKIDIELKNEMNSLRERLYLILSEDKNDPSIVLKISQELDELIVEYTKQSKKIVA